MHPYIRWAIAACWSLHTALTALEARAREAAADATAGSRSGEVSIPSQVFGRRTALGGHGDPTAAQALGAWAPGGPNPDAGLLGDLMRQLDEMAQHLPGAPGMDPLTRIRHAIPTMRPDVAARTGEAVGHLDGIARRKLQMPPDRRPVDGRPPCPACRQRLLYVQTSAPSGDWTVICAGGCVCSGDGCGCGMPVRVEGVPHIWDRSAPIVTQALDGVGRLSRATTPPTRKDTEMPGCDGLCVTAADIGVGGAGLVAYPHPSCPLHAPGEVCECGNPDRCLSPTHDPAYRSAESQP